MMVMIEDIKNIVIKSLGEIVYDRIILFGSQARGDANKDSDYDLMIVVENDIEIKNKRKLQKIIRTSLAEKLICSDVLIRSKNDIEYYQDKAGSVTRSAIKEGVVL